MIFYGFGIFFCLSVVSMFLRIDWRHFLNFSIQHFKSRNSCKKHCSLKQSTKPRLNAVVGGCVKSLKSFLIFTG